MKTLLAIVALSSTLTTASTAFADIDRDTDLIVGEPIWGNCDLQITKNEPYSHMYAPCRLQRHKRDQNGHLQVFVLAEHDLTNFKIGNGWPRSSTFAKVWPLLTPAIPIADWTYCARFGEEQLGIISLGMIFGLTAARFPLQGEQP